MLEEPDIKDKLVSHGLAFRVVDFFVARRPLVHALTILAILVGIVSYFKLPQEIFPPITTNKIEIRAAYSGTSADTFNDIITSRIEDAVQGIEGVRLVESITRDGSCVVTLTLEPDARADDVLFRVRDALDLLRPDFPSDMDTPSVHRLIKKYPLLTLSISGANEVILQRIAKDVQREIERMPDISAATINGKAKEEFHIFLDHSMLEGLGITPSQVVDLIRSSVNNSPLGEIKQQGNHVFITTAGGPHSVLKWQDLILHVGDKRLYLGRIATIKKELSEPKSLSHFDGKRNISLTVFKTAQGSSIDLSKSIHKRLKSWEQTYPGLHFAVYSDLSTYIKNRLNTVKSSAVVGLILVTTCLYLFLNSRVALVVLLGMPTAFLISFTYLGFRGESINMLSLFSFLMALGMVVDDSIVVGENIYRHVELGMDRLGAAVKGTAEVFWPICAATFTTVAAFLPLLMIGGEIGKFLAIIPVFVTTVLIASLVEALSILPVHSAELFRPSPRRKRLANWTPLRSIYKKILEIVLVRRVLVITISLVLLIGSLVVARSMLSFTLLPDFDSDQIYVRGKLGARFGLPETERVVSEIERRIQAVVPKEDLDSIATHIGISFNDKMEFDTGEDLFQVFVNLKKPRPQNWLERWVYPVVMAGTYTFGTRRHSAKYLTALIQKRLAGIKIQRLEVTRPKAGIVRADIDIGLFTSNRLKGRKGNKKLIKELRALEKALGQIKGVENLADNYDPGKIEYEIHVNYRGKQLGFSEEGIAATLIPYYLNPKLVTIMKDVSDDLKVRTYLKGRDRFQNFQGIKINVPGTRQFIYLDEIATIRPREGQARIWKENGTRQVIVTASLDKSVVTSSQVMKRIAPVLVAIEKNGIGYEIRGEHRVAGRTLHDLLIAAIVAIMGIFIVLILQFNSFKDSLIVLVSVPFAFIGVVAGHIVMGQHLCIPSLLGFVGLCGVAVNDAIIMVDFMKRHSLHSSQRLSLPEAASLRLRPIILTSVTTILSLVPLIFFATGQAKILSPMATSFGYGLLAATIANLILIPVMYSLVSSTEN